MKQKTIQEEVPTNNVSSGKIAGAGVGPQGEPGVPKKKKKVDPFRVFIKREK